ncbi:hypothetical protein EC968_002599 [Mortierella alpina]|nr:hypothetical protein EC968_002599 [Mortierella alpina]
MSQIQSFRLIGTTEIVTVPIQHVDGQKVVCWETIEQVFPGVKSVKNGDVPVLHYIKHVPDEVLTVVLSNTTDRFRVESLAPSVVPTVAPNSVQTADATDTGTNMPSDPSDEDNFVEGLRVISAPADGPASDIDDHNSPINPSVLPPSSVFESGETLETASSFIEALRRASKKAKDVNDPTQQQEVDTTIAYVIKLLKEAENRQEEMKQQALKHHQEAKQLQEAADAKQDEVKQLALKHHKEVKQLQEAADAKQEEMIRLQNLALEKQRQMEQQARDHHEEIKQLQIQALDQLAVLQSQVQAVLNQTFELHEYQIPRLFIVLPQYPSGWDILEPFTEKYRLYFLCECGEHTKAAGSSSKIPHKIHLAKHEGYEIARPTEFFQRYGRYILTILKMLKFSISVACVAVPAVAHLLNDDALDHASKGLQHLRDCIKPGMDQVIRKIEKDSVDEGELVEDFNDQMENKEALEGADLRQLETFLKDKDENKVLGNLYRTVTDKGHVKWVCIDHYREKYNQTAVDAFRRVVESLGGSFDENHGLVKVKLLSRAAAEQLYSALRNSRSVYELFIDFGWSCTGTDLKALEYVLRKSAVAILHVDLQHFRPSLSNKLSLVPTRYEALYRLMDPPNIRSIHFVLPSDLNIVSNFTLKRPPHLRKLSFALLVVSDVRIHAEVLETGSTVTTLRLVNYWMGSSEDQALTDAALDLERRSLGDDGVRALSVALKTNATLATLNLSLNSIGDKGAQALSEALKTNSTLTTLNLKRNSIGDRGAQALSEALTTNSTLTTLALGDNSIGDNGAQALSEALKTNSTLTTLELWSNSIGSNGAQALSEALETNATLTTLALAENSIGDNGAQALSEALKTNSTLTTLSLDFNSIGDNGAQALHEARKTNATVTIGF